MKRENLLNVISVLISALFIYASLSKLFDIDKAKVEMMKQVFERSTANILVWVIPIVELITATLIIPYKSRILGLTFSLLLMTIFTAYIILVLSHYFRLVPCSCGGILEHMSYSIHLVFNIFFLLLSMIGIYIFIKERRVKHQRIKQA